MRSTGEVMGIDKHFDTAFAKSQSGANNALPTEGKIFVSVANRDKRSVIMGVKRLSDLGFEIVSTGGTADVLRRNGIQATPVRKVAEGSSAEGEGTIADLVIAGEIDMVFNTPSGGEAAATATNSVRPRRPSASRASPRWRSSTPLCRPSKHSVLTSGP